MVTEIVCQTDSIAYSIDFKLNEGLYMNYPDLRKNKPVSKEKIISEINKEQLDFYSKLIEKEKIEFIDTSGKAEFILSGKVWGYCQNNVVFINYQKTFYRIPVFGAICYFVGVVEVGYYSPAYNAFMDFPVGSTGTGRVKELKEFLFNFYTNELMYFSNDKLLELLKNDTLIYEEYKKLSKKKKKEYASKYIRMYNEKHPVYFPVN